MAKCDEGYFCEICGEPVETLPESELYLRYIVGWLDPETLHTTPERHVRCNPTIAQFIVADEFPPVAVEGPFDKRQLDPRHVAEREKLLTDGWLRLRELDGQEGISLLEYPLDEVIARLQR